MRHLGKWLRTALVMALVVSMACTWVLAEETEAEITASTTITYLPDGFEKGDYLKLAPMGVYDDVVNAVAREDDPFLKVLLTNDNYSFFDLNEGKLVDDTGWYNVHDFSNGLAAVQISDTNWSYVKPDGTLIDPTGWPEVFDFKMGFAKVMNENGKYLLIKEDGTYLNYTEYFDIKDEYGEGFVGVKTANSGNTAWNYLDVETDLMLLETGVNDVSHFENGHGCIAKMVNIRGRTWKRWFFIDETGTQLSEAMLAYDAVFPAEGDLFPVKLGYIPAVGDIKETIVDSFMRREDYSVISESGYSGAEPFSNGYAVVFNEKVVDDKNVIDFFHIKPDGTALYDGTFRNARAFSEGLAPVQIQEGEGAEIIRYWNYVKTDGTLLDDNKYQDCWPFSSGLGLVVTDDDKYMFIKTDGTLLNDTKWDSAVSFKNGFALVTSIDEDYVETTYIMKPDGTLLNENGWVRVTDLAPGIFQVENEDGTFSLVSGKGAVGRGKWDDIMYANEYFVVGYVYNSGGYVVSNWSGTLLCDGVFDAIGLLKNGEENIFWYRTYEGEIGFLSCIENFMLGDVDANGSIAAQDARLVLRASLGKVNLTAEQVTRANVTYGDREIAAQDARLILRRALGKINVFPCED